VRSLFKFIHNTLTQIVKYFKNVLKFKFKEPKIQSWTENIGINYIQRLLFSLAAEFLLQRKYYRVISVFWVAARACKKWLANIC
jgi:hypothetical protein